MGKGMYEVDEICWEKYPDKPAVIGIGQAGEMKLSNAASLSMIRKTGPDAMPGAVVWAP